MAELFGYKFKITKKDSSEAKNKSFAPPVSDDGAVSANVSGFYNTVIDIDAVAKSENDLISQYRDIAMYPDCDSAIEDIVNESVAAEDDEPVVKLKLDSVELSESIKKKIEDEFNIILQLLDFDTKSHDIFKRWYIDGRIYYHKIINESSPKKGIQELRYIDPRKIKKVRKIQKEKDKAGVEIIKGIEEFYIYSEKGIIATVATTGIQNQGIKISPDAIASVTSGLIDMDKNLVLGHLQKAVKVVNQLRMIEDSLVIYRWVRAPQRKAFYIDVGRLPPQKAEQHVQTIMNKYRNKITYNSSTGQISDQKKTMSVLEDYWLPRQEGGKGTEIVTIDGASNLGDMNDVDIFQNKLYQALNVPLSRMKPDQGMSFGRQAEITRDELKFSKFISRLRRKFSELFDDLLKTQVISKGIMSADDWETIKYKIYYTFTQDVYIAEAKEAEILRNRLDLLNTINLYVGQYFSREYVYEKVLKMTEEEVEEIKKQIEEDDVLQQQLQMQQDPQSPGSIQAAAVTKSISNTPSKNTNENFNREYRINNLLEKFNIFNEELIEE